MSNPSAPVWYLGHYSTNPHINGVGVDDELLPWSRVAQDSCHTQCLSVNGEWSLLPGTTQMSISLCSSVLSAS
jgi:hypothetical protein